MVGRGVELLFAASSCPGGKDMIEKGELRFIQKSEGSLRPKNLEGGLWKEM